MSTALVLAGGGSLGAVQVGMLRALIEADVRFDLVVGTSVGAMNAAWVAGDPTPAGVAALTAIWRGLRRRDVFPPSPWQGLLAAAGRRPSLVTSRGLRDLLERHLPFERLDEPQIGLHVVAVDVQTGRDVLLSTGPAVEAVLASTAIPGVLPPVSIDGRWYIDGGVVNNTPISHAVDLGADTVWVLPAGYPCSLGTLPDSAIGMALQGLTLLVQRRLLAEARYYRELVDLRVVPPLCPVAVSPSDFSRTAELLERSYLSTRRWLDHPDTGAEALAPHEHSTPIIPTSRRALPLRADG
jgi:NTE family protein